MKYLIGADGAASATREMLGIPFDGLTTDCYWAIMDAQFKTDFPYILGFWYAFHLLECSHKIFFPVKAYGALTSSSVVISEKLGGVIIIPREDGYTRFYTQITGAKARQLSAARTGRRNASAVGATRIDDHGITAEEVLAQLNLIMAPWSVEFASAMSWFAVWRGASFRDGEVGAWLTHRCSQRARSPHILDARPESAYRGRCCVSLFPLLCDYLLD